MKAHTTIRSRGALALGAFFTAVTARTIFDDVFSGATVTIAHLNAAAALVAAIASGHLFLPTLMQKRIPAAAGLALIFAASTGYIVTSAGARNAEVSQAKAAAITATNDQRDTQRGKVKLAEDDLHGAKEKARTAAAEAKAECDSGKGKRCEGKIATRNHADGIVEKSQSHLDLMRGQLYLLGAEQQPFAGYMHAARVFEAANLGDADVIEARLELLMPFALVLISEFGTLVFLGMALGHRLRLPEQIPANDAAPAVTGNRNGRIPGKPKPPKGGRRGRKSDLRVIDFSEAFSRKHGRTPTGGEIRAQFPDLPSSTAYDYASRCRASQTRAA